MHSWLFISKNERQSCSEVNGKIFLRIHSWHNTIIYPPFYSTWVTTYGGGGGGRDNNNYITFIHINFEVKHTNSML